MEALDIVSYWISKDDIPKLVELLNSVDVRMESGSPYGLCINNYIATGGRSSLRIIPDGVDITIAGYTIIYNSAEKDIEIRVSNPSTTSPALSVDPSATPTELTQIPGFTNWFYDSVNLINTVLNVKITVINNLLHCSYYETPAIQRFIINNKVLQIGISA